MTVLVLLAAMRFPSVLKTFSPVRSSPPQSDDRPAGPWAERESGTSGDTNRSPAQIHLLQEAKMKRAACIAISVTAFGLGACGDSKTQEQAAPSPEVAITTKAEEIFAPSSSGQQFANTVSSNDIFEIETSRLAATNASSPDVKKFAEQMIAGHTATTTKLNAAAGAASPVIIPATEISPAQQQIIDNLALMTGADFDAAYARAQVDAHQAALDELKAYAQNGDVPTLTVFATETIPVVTRHLDLAKKL